MTMGINHQRASELLSPHHLRNLGDFSDRNRIQKQPL